MMNITPIFAISADVVEALLFIAMLCLCLLIGWNIGETIRRYMK